MSEKKTTLTIRLDLMEKLRIKRWAHEVGQSASEYILEAVRERLTRDEMKPGEQSDLDLMQAELRKEPHIVIGGKPDPELEKKSLDDLIEDFVRDEDTTV